MRVLICPDSFKGSLTADDAAAAIRAGVEAAARSVGMPADIAVHPVSDGGEGFAHLIARAINARTKARTIPGPLDDPIQCGFAEAQGELFLDAASAIGLPLVPAGKRNPMRLTSAALGRLIASALNDHPRAHAVTLGLGGTATMDMGLGALQALGVELQDDQRQPVSIRPPVPEAIARFATFTVNPGTPAERLATGRTKLRLAVDTLTPLLGKAGAARRFGPQKGASPRDIAHFEAAHQRCAHALASSPTAIDPETPGAGAAGGIPVAFAAALGATVEPGFSAFANRTALRAKIESADLVITGEGRFDEQSLAGKAVGALIDLARDAAPSASILVLPAKADPKAVARLDASKVRVHPAVAQHIDDQRACTHAATFLESAAAEHVRTMFEEHRNNANRTGA